MSWTTPGIQNVIAIGLGVSAPQIRDFDVLEGVTSFLRFFGFLQLATADTRKRIVIKNTSKDLFPAKDMPFGGADDSN